MVNITRSVYAIAYYDNIRGKMENYLFIVDISEIRGTFVKSFLIEEGCEVYSLEEELYFQDKKKVYVFSLAMDLDLNKVKNLDKYSYVFGRTTHSSILEYFKTKNIKFLSYFDDEAFVVKNAYLTAEGALAYVIQNTNITIKQMPVLVLGYGRLGKSVAKLLKDNYAIVDVATDDNTEYALASIYADKVFTLSEYQHSLGEYKVVVNTIPQQILKGEVLKLLDKDCFVMDLASKPGGVNFQEADILGIKYMHALGIPGKTSPKTAGQFIAESILKRLKNFENEE